jgi:hypothetical protein
MSGALAYAPPSARIASAWPRASVAAEAAVACAVLRSTAD